MNRLLTFFAPFLLSILIPAPCVGQDSLAAQRSLALSKDYFVQKGLLVEQYAFDDTVINTKLREIQFYDQKAEQKTVAAGVLTVIGVLLVVGSATVVSGKNYSFNSSSSAAPVLFMTGIGCSLVSIPLWISSGKPRKARNAAIAEANALLMR